MELDKVKAACQICCPFDLLVKEYLPKIIEQRINPEIGLTGRILDEYEWSDFQRAANTLRGHGLHCTIHAPFVDLSIGAIDRMVRQATLERLKKSLDVAALFNATAIVCHTGFDPRHHQFMEQEWKENALESLATLLEYSKDIPLTLENVFETSPEIHRFLLATTDSTQVGFCLDIGHLYAFARGDLENWFHELKPWLMQLHLHDNMLENDDHLPIGRGSIDFEALFALLLSNGNSPLITLEPHKEEDVIPSLQGLGELLDLYPVRRISSAS